MRLFAALLPPAEVLDEVSRAVAPQVGRLPGVRWVGRDTWHLTLAFYGEVPDGDLPQLAVRLARAARRQRELELAFEGAGEFGSKAVHLMRSHLRPPVRYESLAEWAFTPRPGV